MDITLRNDITRLRIYDLFAKISRLNDEALLMFRSSVIFKHMTSGFETSDCIFQMNLLEIFKMVPFMLLINLISANTNL